MGLTTPPPIAEELENLRGVLRNVNPLAPSMMLNNVRAVLENIHGLVQLTPEIQQEMGMVLDAAAKLGGALNVTSALVERDRIEVAKASALGRVYRLEQALKHAEPSGQAEDLGLGW